MESMLWQVLLRASVEESPLSCEDCYVLIDYLSDLLCEGYSPGVVFPLAEKVLKRCPNCDEEHRKEIHELLLLPAAGLEPTLPARTVASG